MSHRNLGTYYTLLHSLTLNHNYSISDLEGLIPFELDIYADLTIEHIKQKEKEAANIR